MATVQSIVQAAAAGDDIAGLVDEYRREHGASFSATVDRVAVAVARGFLDGQMTYSDGDLAANTLWTLMCNAGQVELEAIPDLAHAVFDAFDQGEFPHGNDLDPVEHYTIPLLRSALSQPRTGGNHD